jgi:hypothetical protein
VVNYQNGPLKEELIKFCLAITGQLLILFHRMMAGLVHTVALIQHIVVILHLVQEMGRIGFLSTMERVFKML